MVPYSFFMLCNMADAMKLWILIGPYAKCLGDWLTEVDNILQYWLAWLTKGGRRLAVTLYNHKVYIYVNLLGPSSRPRQHFQALALATRP